MAVDVGSFESNKFRKLFEFIKKHGVEELYSFLDDYDSLVGQDLINLAIVDGKHPTISFVNKHREFCRLIRELDSGDVPFVLRNDFRAFFNGVLTDDILQKYIEGARSLEELGVSRIRFMPNDDHHIVETLIKYGYNDEIECIVKNYSNINGLIEYSVNEEETTEHFIAYNTSIRFPDDFGNFIITAANHESGLQFRYAMVSDFSFDPSLLPSGSELSLYAPPLSLITSKVYMKR